MLAEKSGTLFSANLTVPVTSKLSYPLWKNGKKSDFLAAQKGKVPEWCTIERLEKDIEKYTKLIQKMRNGINIGKNIIFWRESGGYWLKLTDYKKGYWAQVPLSPAELEKLCNLFMELINATRLPELRNYLIILREEK